MANTDPGVRTSELPVKTGASANDRVLILGTGANQVTATIKVSDLFTNSTVSVKPAIFVLPGQSPANSTISVLQGQMFFDNNYIYVAVANNVLKRAPLNSF